MVRADGNRYEGEFQDDLKHGKGLFYHLDNGLVQDGVWHKDMCIYSQMRDLEYRQCAIDPTPYPIPPVSMKEKYSQSYIPPTSSTIEELYQNKRFFKGRETIREESD